MNGDFATRVDQLLANEQISQDAAIRLTLELLKGLYESAKEQEDKNEEFEKRLKAIETERENEVKQKNSVQFYYRTTVGAALTAIVVLLINGFIYFVKILPILEQSRP